MRKSGQTDWKSPTFEGLCPSQVEWAMMAAYIDGEGSVLINPRRGRIGVGDGLYSSLSATFYLKIQVSNTDVRLPIWLKQRFGGSFVGANTERYYEGKNFKRAWHWTASCGRATWILYNCLPYFVMKAEQAEIGIGLQESMAKFVRGGGRSLPMEVVEERRDLKRRLLVLKARGRTVEDAQAERIKEVS